MIPCSGQLVSTPMVVFQVEAQDAEIIAELLGVGLATSDLFTLPETILTNRTSGHEVHKTNTLNEEPCNSKVYQI